MFTGIIEELGTVRAITPVATGANLTIAATTVLEDTQIGESISVNGCCLTVVTLNDGYYAVDVVEETLKMTCLGSLQVGDRVNLERSVRLADRLGGHLVQGHVDGVGTLMSREPALDGSLVVRIDAPAEVLRYVVYKGSIAVDGISLTVAAIDATSFSIALIPHTQDLTTLGFRQPGDKVNLEVDIIAKYVEKLLAPAIHD